jgi:hypothetical protein
MRKNHGDSPNLKEPPEADILPFAPQRLKPEYRRWRPGNGQIGPQINADQQGVDQ